MGSQTSRGGVYELSREEERVHGELYIGSCIVQVCQLCFRCCDDDVSSVCTEVVMPCPLTVAPCDVLTTSRPSWEAWPSVWLLCVAAADDMFRIIEHLCLLLGLATMSSPLSVVGAPVSLPIGPAAAVKPPPGPVGVK